MNNARGVHTMTELIPMQQTEEMTVLPPDSGAIGRFLEETANMFKARTMRMGGLLRRINESGQRTELILRMAAERMEAAESCLEQDLRMQGLVSEADGTENANE